LLALIVPFSVAEFEVIAVAEVVMQAGGVGGAYAIKFTVKSPALP
jgi:hypothetical protein